MAVDPNLDQAIVVWVFSKPQFDMNLSAVSNKDVSGRLVDSEPYLGANVVPATIQ